MNRLIFIFFSGLLLANSNAQIPVNGKLINDTSIIIIKVWGNHQERGYAHGYLLGEKISTLFDKYLNSISTRKYKKIRKIFTEEHLFKLDNTIVTEAKSLITGMTDANRNTKKLDYIDILICNTLFDLVSIKHLSGVKTMGCSSLMSWGKATLNTDLNGKSVISRHFDWYNIKEFVQNQAIIIHIPSEPSEQPWLNVGFAGQLGITSGISKSGISAFVHALPFQGGRGSNKLTYEPIMFAVRKSLEQKDFNKDLKSDVLDVKDALLSNPDGYAQGALVCALGPAVNRKNEEIAFVAELTPDTSHFTFRGAEFNDSIPGDNLYAANSLLKKNNKIVRGRRNKAVISAFENTGGINISSQKNWGILRDYSRIKVPFNYIANVCLLQYVPENKTLKISASKDKTKAYRLQPQTFDLREWFQ